MHTTPPTPATRRRRLSPLVAATALLVFAGACGSDDEAADTTATIETTVTTDTTGETLDDTTPTDAADTAALEAAADELVVVCQDRDPNRLNELSGAGTQDRLRDRDPVTLFADNVEAITVLDRQVAIDGDDGTVTVTLEISTDGETSEVERVWTYERIDDSWVLADVPDCLFI